MSQWSAAGRQAWNFCISGVERGLTATDALTQYRAGGGAIRNQTWYAQYRSAFSVYGKAERIKAIPVTYVVPESMFEDSGFDWREEYVMQMTARVSDPETGERHWRNITVESDVLLTRREWMNLAQEAIDFSPGSLPAHIEYIQDYKAYHRLPRI